MKIKLKIRKATIRAKIIRANGKVENLGIIFQVKNKLRGLIRKFIKK